MPLQTNLNIKPYYDDFDDFKNFYRVLYKSGYPVQARELTQSQSILQDQIEKLASRILKEGDNVVPGEFSLNLPVSYVRVSSITQGSTAEEFEGFTLKGVTSGVIARVVFATASTDDDDTTFYVNYESSGNSGEYTTFVEGETLESSTPNFYTATVGISTISKPIGTAPMGQGSLFTVKPGSYFVDGFVVRNDEQTITLDKYGVEPSYRVGFVVEEDFVTSNEDSSLLDNSQGSSNFAAPGADRLKITLTLVKRDPDVQDANFIQLAEIHKGNILGNPANTVKWDWLYDILAQRTFDESGDYIVSDFPIKTYEYWNSDNVDGVFDADPETFTYPAVPGSQSEARLSFAEADAKYALRVNPGSAYVQGYSVGYENPVYLYGNKARDLNFRPTAVTEITEGYNISVTNCNSAPDFQNINGDGFSQAFTDLVLYHNFIDGFVGESVEGGRPKNTGNAPWTTYHVVTDQPITGSIQQDIIDQDPDTNGGVLYSPTQEIRRGDTIGGAKVLISTKILPRPSGVIRPRYFTQNQMVDDNTGYYGYNSTYKLGIMTSLFFTELALAESPDESWTIGDLVFGERSGAFATVEEGSSDEFLIVSNTVGEFVAGETVTQGDKVGRIYKSGEVSGFHFTDAGPSGNIYDLSGEDEITISAIGSTLTLSVADGYITTTPYSIDLTAEGRALLLNFPYPEGSSFSNRINYEVETKNGVKGYAIIIPAKVTNTLTKTKSFFSKLDDLTTDKFSADISIQTSDDAEIVNIADNSLFSGNKGQNFVTCDNFSGDASDQLVSGDLVTLVDDTGRSINRLVYFVTKPIGYGSLRSKSVIYFTTAIPNKVTGKTIQRVRVKSSGSSDQNLIFQLPQKVVATLETDPLTTRINYTVNRQFYVKVNSGATLVTITTTKDNEIFVGNSDKTNIFIVNDNDLTIEGRSLTLKEVIFEDGGRKVIYELNEPAKGNVTLKILTQIFVTDAKAKRKIFRDGMDLEKPVDPIFIDYDITSPDDFVSSPASQLVVSLGIADVYAINSVKMGEGNSKIDVTDNYIFDNGQRDNIYDISRLILKPGRPKAIGPLEVNCAYFEHSDEGDFFSVDSYTDDLGILYAAVPVYAPNSIASTTDEFDDSLVIQLRDCVDFRPVVNTLEGEYTSDISLLTPGVDSQYATNFRDSSNSGNGFSPRIPVSGTQFLCDVSYYLPRYDSLFLENTGALTLIEGKSAEKPIIPPDITNGIRLYDIYLPAYTFSVDHINNKKYNYKRYRMKDIASIEKRINRVEELMTLSILEQSALNMSVRDAVTGLDRFKNGIIVDGFHNHSRGEVGSEQYRNSIDPKNGHLRSQHYTDQAELEELHQTDEQRAGDNYRLNDGVLTVNYDEVRFLQNPFATRFFNLQPFSVFTYDGNLELTPSVDTWQDITRLPDLVVEDNSLFDAMVNLTGEMADNGFGTVWGDWETTGTNTTSNSTNIRNTANNANAVNAALGALAIQGVNVGTGNLNQGGMNMLANGQRPPLTITNTTTTVDQSRTETQSVINVSTGRVERTSYGDRVVDVQLARTMRTVPVLIQAYRLKPNTRYYAFFDDINVTEWVSIDNTENVPGRGNVYVGVPNTNPQGFGQHLLSDDVGTLTGVFLIPNGRSPVAGSTFNGDLQQVEYNTSGPTRSFTTGQRTLRITSHPLNSKDNSQVDGHAEAVFTASGVIMDKQETIVSTRIPSFATTTRVTGTETRSQESTETSANYFDPVAQTFLVDDNSPEGVFVTELDVFFKDKDPNQPVEAYLVSTEGQVPTEVILPHSRVVKDSDTTVRVVSTLGANAETLTAGVTLVGQISGATGIVKTTSVFDSDVTNPTRNVSNTVFNIVMSNYDGQFVPGEDLVPDTVPASDATFTIAGDEVLITRVDISALGKNYTDATVEFSEPELPGGVTATAEARVKDGMVFDIKITSFGSGYTKAPSINIIGDGSEAEAKVRIKKGRGSVHMGVATSPDGTVATKFKFNAPVYLLGSTYYAFVVKAPTSLKYNIWASKLGENLVGTETRVSEQPSLGSMFKSQNGGLWTEDQTVDLKFVIRRADFFANTNSTLKLVNAPLPSKAASIDPIETSSSGINEDSDIFGDNSRIVKIHHPVHGLAPNDLVKIEGIESITSGIPLEELNTLHTVINSDLHNFTIKVTTPATSSIRFGGTRVMVTVNRPYEVINVYTGLMAFGTSQLATTITSSQHAGVTLYNQPYQYRVDIPQNINLMESFYYGGAKQVASRLNESKYRGSLYLQGNKSLQTTIDMMTLSSKVSPVIDLYRTNATISRNIIDNPDPDDAMYGVRTSTVTLKDTFDVTKITENTNLKFTTDGVSQSATIRSVNPTTKKIVLNGKYANLIKSNSIFDNAALLDGVVDEVVDQDFSEQFIPETRSNGTVYSKWISRLFLFENLCDGVELKLSCIFYNRNDIKVYFKPKTVGFDFEVSDVPWIPFNGTALPNGVDVIKPRSSDNVDPNIIQSAEWQSLTWSAQDLAKFDGIQIKIVMTSDNPAQAPLIDDMQLVASE